MYITKSAKRCPYENSANLSLRSTYVSDLIILYLIINYIWNIFRYLIWKNKQTNKIFYQVHIVRVDHRKSSITNYQIFPSGNV